MGRGKKVGENEEGVKGVVEGVEELKAMEGRGRGRQVGGRGTGGRFRDVRRCF